MTSGMDLAWLVLGFLLVPALGLLFVYWLVFAPGDAELRRLKREQQ